jgi:hypothetical protein
MEQSAVAERLFGNRFDDEQRGAAQTASAAPRPRANGVIALAPSTIGLGKERRGVNEASCA